MVTLHIIAPYHTVTSREFSHCAFSMKVMNFGRMMVMKGWRVIEYGNEGSESEAEKVMILSRKELDDLVGHRSPTSFVGDKAVRNSPVWTRFDKILVEKMKEKVVDHDIICYPFGDTHPSLRSLFPNCTHVETGIGYPNTFARFRIFESSAWMHWHMGKENKVNGHKYTYVIPNYYDLRDWTPRYEQGSYILFFGRICQSKGLAIIVEIAKRLDTLPPHVPRKIIICGQGNPLLYTHQHIEYRPPISGTARSDLLSNAYCMLMPTMFLEPFGGAGVEGMLCGTPLIASNYGAFMETVEEGMGFRCNTLRDWLESLVNIPSLDRREIADRARSKYSLESVGRLYDKAFRDLNDLWGKGWYS